MKYETKVEKMLEVFKMVSEKFDSKTNGFASAPVDVECKDVKQKIFIKIVDGCLVLGYLKDEKFEPVDIARIKDFSWPDMRRGIYQVVIRYNERGIVKIKFDANIKLERVQAGLVLGKALRLGPDASGALVLTPAGEFVVVNKRAIKPQDKNEALIALIIAARDKCELTQKELAVKIGVTENAVFSWENGRRNPPLLSVMAILWICGIVGEWEGIEK